MSTVFGGFACTAFAQNIGLVRTLAKASSEHPGNVAIVAASWGVGLIPIAMPGFCSGFPAALQVVLNSGISAGCLTAVVLNLVFGERLIERSTATELSSVP
ncbi:hypothetical protein AB0F91_22115 [Amycolatopsis sp. NPDC023774]|uniref:hypothetical protein n=1 Tax=Amycolatopsis sp. NPDC023774 TaxID=3155015 RepID=UPI0034081B8A